MGLYNDSSEVAIALNNFMQRTKYSIPKKAYRALCAPFSLFLLFPLYPAYFKRMLARIARASLRLFNVTGESKEAFENWCLHNIEVNLKTSKEWFDDFKNNHGSNDVRYSCTNSRGIEQFIFEKRNGSSQDININEKKYRIFCAGNGGDPESHFQALSYNTLHEGNVNIAFSHPGNSGSDGIVLSKEDIINSIVDQAMALRRIGVPASNITFAGMSLGAASSACAYEKFKTESEKENGFEGGWPTGSDDGPELYLDRTFVSTSDVVSEYAVAPFRSPLLIIFRLPLLREAVGLLRFSFKYLIFKPLFVALNWDLNVQEAYLAVPAKNRVVISIKARKSKSNSWFVRKLIQIFKIKSTAGDATIPAESQLGHSQSDQGRLKTLKYLIKSIKEDVSKGNEAVAKSSLKSLVDYVNENQHKNVFINKMVYAKTMDVENQVKTEGCNVSEVEEKLDEVLQALKIPRIAVEKAAEWNDVTVADWHKLPSEAMKDSRNKEKHLYKTAADLPGLMNRKGTLSSPASNKRSR